MSSVIRCTLLSVNFLPRGVAAGQGLCIVYCGWTTELHKQRSEKEEKREEWMHRLVSGASRIDRCISYCLKGLCFIDPGYFYTVYLETHTQSHTHTHTSLWPRPTHTTTWPWPKYLFKKQSIPLLLEKRRELAGAANTCFFNCGYHNAISLTAVAWRVAVPANHYSN